MQDVRNAVAVVVRRGDRVLAVRRPDEPGEELPGIWGLPATTIARGERIDDAVRRIGREKLGVELAPVRSIGEGDQQRDGYTLHMTVYDASMAGEPTLPARTAQGASTHYDGIDWLPATSFGAAADAGSLCCRVFLEAEGLSLER